MAFTHRSEATRSAILSAARDLLARKGYQSATIRAVAAQAGIDPSMVMRYYGSKEGLFAAAIDVDLKLPQPSTHPPEQLGAVLARHLIARWEGPSADAMIRLLLRSAATTPAAADQMRTIFGTQVLHFVREAIGDRDDVPRRAVMISSQVLGVALCRYILELPPLVEVASETLIATLAPVLQHYLTGALDLAPPATLGPASLVMNGGPDGSDQ